MVLMLTSIILTTSIFLVNSETNFISHDEYSREALECAQLGINDYLWKINDEDCGICDETIKVDGERCYELNVKEPTDDNKYLTISSIGWEKENPKVKKCIEVKLDRKQFVNYVFVTNSENLDRKRDYIYWLDKEECHGPIHTNGIFATYGKPVFYNTVTYYVDKFEKNGKPDYKEGGSAIKVSEPLTFPDSNSELAKWAKDETDKPYFEGRTCIYLNGNKAVIRDNNGRVHNIDIRKNKVIYVDGKIVGNEDKFNLEAGNVFVSGKLSGRLTIVAKNNIYITYDDPTNWKKPIYHEGISYPNKKDDYGITYANTKFNHVDNNNICERTADGEDMLGLIANNNVLILHYGWPRDGSNGKPYWDKERVFLIPRKFDVAPKDIKINAAIFAIKGGFGYEGYSKGGKRGDIQLWGSIIQNERLPVGKNRDYLIFNIDSGYNKKYFHDPRMSNIAPPHFLEPKNLGWQIVEWQEVPLDNGGN